MVFNRQLAELPLSSLRVKLTLLHAERWILLDFHERSVRVDPGLISVRRFKDQGILFKFARNKSKF